jgi:hypothetical protein
VGMADDGASGTGTDSFAPLRGGGGCLTLVLGSPDHVKKIEAIGRGRLVTLSIGEVVVGDRLHPLSVSCSLGVRVSSKQRGAAHVDKIWTWAVEREGGRELRCLSDFRPLGHGRIDCRTFALQQTAPG